MTFDRVRFQKWWYLGLAVIVFSIFLRFWRLDQPKGYYFDEVYHAVTAKLVGRNDPAAYEWTNPEPEPNTAVDWLHPPFAKLTQGLSMYLLGENELAWRLSSAIVGSVSLFLLWKVALKLTDRKEVALLAVVLFSLDGLALTMSRIAMNDMHVTAAILLSVWLYWRWKEKPTVQRAIAVGLSTGLALGTKWSGFFLLPLFAFDQGMGIFWALLHGKVPHWKVKAIFALSLAWFVPAMYLLSYQQMFLQGKDWDYFRELHNQIWWYQTNLDATHPYQSAPLQWILDLRPVYAYTGSTAETLKNIYLLANPVLAWTGLIAVFWLISDVLFVAFRYAHTAVTSLHGSHKNLNVVQEVSLDIEDSHKSWFLLAAYAVFWMPWLFSPRIMFFYHYLPSIPFLCLILAQQLDTLPSLGKWGRWLKIGVIVSIFMTFCLFLPNWLAWSVPTQPWGSLFFALESWR